MAKKRLDQILVERGLAPSRERAKSIILAGLVDVNGQRNDKPGTPVPQDADITVRGPDHPYVSRGGLKLEAALDAFGIDPAGRLAVDIGASTGGFTDCMLQRGARRVYAIDVGYNQLDYKLRTDDRVVVFERENIRHFDVSRLEELPDLAVIDVSFISLELVLPKAVELTTSPADLIALVKPQFEAGRDQVGKGGIVRDPQVRQMTVEKIARAATDLGLEQLGVVESPIHGAKGNVEFLLALKKP